MAHSRRRHLHGQELPRSQAHRDNTAVSPPCPGTCRAVCPISTGCRAERARRNGCERWETFGRHCLDSLSSSRWCHRANSLIRWCRRGESNPHESHPSPDFESWRAPSEKLRKANKALGIRGFSPNLTSDLFSFVEFPRWTKSGRRNSASDIEANSRKILSKKSIRFKSILSLVVRNMV